MSDAFEQNLRDYLLDGETMQMGLVYEGPRIVESMARVHGSLRKLATAIGVSPAYLSGVVNQRWTISASVYLRICDDARKIMGRINNFIDQPDKED